MSTDANQTPLIAKPRKGYAFYEHHNSNNSRRRGRGDGIFKNHVTIRTVRFPDGGPLPHLPTPSGRSKYMPHVGAKQLAKLKL